jgi:hypothetical protein
LPEPDNQASDSAGGIPEIQADLGIKYVEVRNDFTDKGILAGTDLKLV